MSASVLRRTTPCVCTTAKKLSRVLGRAYDSYLSESGVNNTQYAVMRSVARLSGEPLVRLAEDLEMDRTSLYRAIGPMIRNGWLLAVGTGSRTRTVQFTKKGLRIFAEATSHWETVQRKIIGGFGGKELDFLLEELYRLSQRSAEATR